MLLRSSALFFFNDTATTEIYTLSLHDALPICYHCWTEFHLPDVGWFPIDASEAWKHKERRDLYFGTQPADRIQFTDRKSTRLNSSHSQISYAVFCLKKKKKRRRRAHIKK